MAAKPKPETDKRTQRQKFIDKARELGCSEDNEVLDKTLKQIASAPASKTVEKRKTRR